MDVSVEMWGEESHVALGKRQSTKLTSTETVAAAAAAAAPATEGGGCGVVLTAT